MDPLETIREHFDSFARGDEDAHAATYAENCVIEEPEDLPWGGRYEGTEGQQELVRHYDAAWDEVSVTPLHYAVSGEVVVALVRLEGRTANGRDVEMSTIEWFRVGEDGIVEQRVFYWDPGSIA